MNGLLLYRSMDWELVNIAHLRPHERTLPHRVDEMLQKLRTNNFFHKPILVDRATMAILDGHHRYTASLRLGLHSVPALVLDYLEDDGVKVEAWPPHAPDSVSKEDVVAVALSQELMPPKTTHHTIAMAIPQLSVPLSELRSIPC